MLTEKQLETHNRCITGSKIASILGLSPWNSKWQLFAEMHGDIEPPDISTVRMKMGGYAEKMMDEYVEKELGWNIASGPEEGKFHPKYTFLWGLVDRLQLNETSQPARIIEYKNVSVFAKKDWEEGPPDYYRSQIHFYSALWDLPATFFTIFGGNDPQVFEVERDKEIEGYIIDQAVVFWDDLQNDRYPKPDGSDFCTKTLAKMFASPDAKLIPGDQDTLDMAIEYHNAQIQEKEVTERTNFWGNRLREAIGNHNGFLFDDGSKATWKKNKDSLKFDQKKFKDENPELAKGYYGLVPGPRVLRVDIKK